MGDHNLRCRSLRCSGLGAEQTIVRNTRDLTVDVPTPSNLGHRTSVFLTRPLVLRVGILPAPDSPML